MIKMRTCKQWMHELPVSYCEALAELHEPNDLLTPNEVLDSVVSYHGGVATGFEIRCLVENIYGVNLTEVAYNG